MLNTKNKGLLLSIITHCKRIEEKTANCNKTSFIKDRDTNDIVCYNIFQIGELAKDLDNELITTSLNKVKCMGDKIAHEYGSIDMDKVWSTATEDVRSLREYCEKIISENYKITGTTF